MAERVFSDEELRILGLRSVDALREALDAADAEKALAVAVNAKMRRPGICGARPCLLPGTVHPQRRRPRGHRIQRQRRRGSTACVHFAGGASQRPSLRRHRPRGAGGDHSDDIRQGHDVGAKESHASPDYRDS